MPINDKLNQHIKTNYDGPNEQAELVKRHFSQEKHKDFLKKIKIYVDFSHSNLMTLTESQSIKTKSLLIK